MILVFNSFVIYSKAHTSFLTETKHISLEKLKCFFETK